MASLEESGALWPGAVAVSGGGDSIALMHLLARWAKRAKREAPIVVTVDHGLKPQSAMEARKVSRWAKEAGLKTSMLAWKGAKPKSNIEAEARDARYRLMGEWLRKKKLAALYVAHSLDDQAETFLIRLIRGSGLDGLSAMQPVSPYPAAGFGGVRLVRPLLEIERAALRSHLAERQAGWLEDPMNDDDRFARVRIRKAWAALEKLGLSRRRLVDAANHLSRAREALDAVTLAVLSRTCKPVEGGLHVDRGALAAAPREVALRALAQMLMVVGAQAYRPRFESLERLLDRIAEDGLGGGATLHGCQLTPARRGQGAFGAGTLVISAEKPKAGRRGTGTANR
jgi:tRNA(Ile)-lysidine synthase